MARPDRDVDGGGSSGANASPPSFPLPFLPTTGLDFGLRFEASFGLGLSLVWCCFFDNLAALRASISSRFWCAASRLRRVWTSLNARFSCSSFALSS
jgi:hypothetical protein